MITFELGNDCNHNCLFCRTEKGEIYDQNPSNCGARIPRGRMPYELYTEVIRQVKDHLLIAVLYVNGEPMIYRQLADAIKYATNHKVATMLSTNGQLMNEKKIYEILEAGLDFIKVAISGFTNETYQIQHRNGDVQIVLSNINTLVRVNREEKYGTVVMIDYILYDYNVHELAQVRSMCEEMGIILNIRPDNLNKLDVAHPKLFSAENIDVPKVPLTDLCEWPWQVLTINWDGSVYPCCDYVVWNDVDSYTKITTEKCDIPAIMNGAVARNTRNIHLAQGRTGISICSQCPRTGTAFKS